MQIKINDTDPTAPGLALRARKLAARTIALAAEMDALHDYIVETGEPVRRAGFVTDRYGDAIAMCDGHAFDARNCLDGARVTHIVTASSGAVARRKGMA